MPQSTTPSKLRDISLPDSTVSPALAAVSAAAALRRLRRLVGDIDARHYCNLSGAILQMALAEAAAHHQLDKIRTPKAFTTVCEAVWEDYRFHFLHTPDLIDPDDEHSGADEAALELVAYRIPSFVAANLGADYASLSPFVSDEETDGPEA